MRSAREIAAEYGYSCDPQWPPWCMTFGTAEDKP